MTQISVLGIDIAKQLFHVREHGHTVKLMALSL
jgi:hypothetical protein